MFENSQQTTPNANEVNKFTFKGKKYITNIKKHSGCNRRYQCWEN